MNFNFLKKNLSYFLILLLLVFIGYQVYSPNDEYDKELLSIDTSDEKSFSQNNDIESDNLEINSNSENQAQELFVHVSGAVKNPGLYKLSLGSRVADAIELAGGALENANLDVINLAKKLNDEEKIYLPLLGEDLPPAVATNSSNINSSNLPKINLNTADHKELTQIPGVGEKTADKIIEYRANSPFNTIDDLKRVDGIGDKKFESMRDFVTT
ncbi:competence protein ComEA [Peptoniphilus olsenii]|uniref:Competence protein ComEA n=1 Tax=Peptoniphilus olsenii TaxID=411570 RepID=A0ABV2J9R3_9FIRM